MLIPFWAKYIKYSTKTEMTAGKVLLSIIHGELEEQEGLFVASVGIRHYIFTKYIYSATIIPTNSKEGQWKLEFGINLINAQTIQGHSHSILSFQLACAS